MRRLLWLMPVWLLLSACSFGPQWQLDEKVERHVAASEAVSRFAELQGKPLVWGGKIIATRNLAESSVIELLLYPLDWELRPKLDAQPEGRVWVKQSGYLEPLDYAPGRRLTAYGSLTELQQGKVGESEQTFPLLSADKLHLWAKGDYGPQIHFGFGMVIGR